ncbi:1-acyl-sn-glycerol-3-phosphate acyltransferase [Sphingomonas sp. BT-65]|uniref:lysophospholipid acyltransferase family protein n=1 Tax=Sphingomonas sp. BT-65 TaxID=2989821 RepID=UPI0022369670|nr:lysophospholipid acyltransferase family protein [Sphingomonas sp. BT-65]MCW4462292.1 1-acyl-sn-glycerol-3-phosphate acyltransferase [Sphingomonas sp. BT-65]
MAKRLRSFAFAIFFYGLSVPIVLGAPVAALFGARILRPYCMAWARFGVWSARHIAGIRIHVDGQRAAGPALYAAKHQAMLETMALAVMLDAPAIVMKRELAQIPVWGWAAQRYGVIVVDRAANAKALRQMMREARDATGEGRSVLIFPEGTRVAPGETPPLRSGFAGLYRALSLTVVPVALDSGRLWPRRGPKRGGIVTFRFGAPVPPGLPRAEAEDAVHRGINALES